MCPKTVFLPKVNALKIKVDFFSRNFKGPMAEALVDTGATHNFITRRLAKEQDCLIQKLYPPRIVRNVDGTPNKGGAITEYVDLEVSREIGEWSWASNNTSQQRFFITNLGTDEMILGYPWVITGGHSLNWEHPEKNPPLIVGDSHWVATYGLPDEDGVGNKTFPDPPKHRIHRILPGEQLIMRLYKTTHAQRLAESAADTTKREWTDLVPPELHDFAKVFSEDASQRLPEHQPWDHAIELLDGAPPVLDCKVYPLTLAEQEALDKFLEEHLAKGYIRPSKSPYAAPFFFVKKKDGKLRPVQDYRRLNAWTRKNRYPLPLLAELVDKVPGRDFYTTLDVRWGYHNIRIKDGDQWKAAFKTNRGLYEPDVMYFGLTNSPASWQALMDDRFCAEIAQGWLKIYMDDFLIATYGSRADHLAKVRIVLQRLLDNDLYLKPEKCHFAQKSVEYLGMIVGSHGVSMDSVKLDGILNWPTPTSVTEVRSFLRFGNFYKPFIRDYAKIARPLHDLTKKGTPFAWTPNRAAAFQRLKDAFASEPVLAAINYDRPFILYTDASAFAVGATLVQVGDDNLEHPVGFFSASLQPAEINYDIFDRELYAIVRALRHFRHLLLGARHPIRIFTDHKNLSYFREPHKISGRQARWLEFLAEFDFSLHQIAGSANAVADLLSRRPDLKEGVHINDNVTLLPDHLFVHRISLPHDQNVYRQVVRELHDTPIAGHPGIANTWALVKQRYDGPHLKQFVEQYVKGCPTCQMNKAQRSQGKAPTQHLDTPVEEGPFQYVSMDLITDLPPSGAYDAILTIVDQGCTKAAKFIPCTKTITGEGVAVLYIRHLLPWFGLPKRIISDRDPRFTSVTRRRLVQLDLSKGFL